MSRTEFADIQNEDITDRYSTSGGARVIVYRDTEPHSFAARCEACGWIGSRAHTSTSVLGDLYDAREEVRQLAETHAASCRRAPERLRVGGAR